jgi:hypothetical protein
MRQLALTTGASIGIGQVYAERLVEQRYDLVLVGRRRGRLDSFAASITGAAVHVACLGSRKRSSTPCKAWISPEYSRRLKPPTDLIDLLMRSDPSCLDQLHRSTVHVGGAPPAPCCSTDPPVARSRPSIRNTLPQTVQNLRSIILGGRQRARRVTAPRACPGNRLCATFPRHLPRLRLAEGAFHRSRSRSYLIPDRHETLVRRVPLHPSPPRVNQLAAAQQIPSVVGQKAPG